VEAAMQRVEYTQITQVRDPKTKEWYWSDHKNWKMFPIARLNKFAEEGWELAAAYSIEEGNRVIFILKRYPLL
jgi:hypothetical protein